ncbi:MAG: alpha/beta hydrolase [Moorea sp. SIO4E2]|uniref:sulfotransferase n=1 Tax=Moorena sp. SIO4E2 TaxID=2607826 RepID=UPI0013B667B0|nr:sulfotransferase [Moorena sp. SIO4E2]NEQ05157.1 alpha/beta hydrolase [Moorena sp. SIO4E2]
MQYAYKQTPQGELMLDVHLPSGWKSVDRRPAVVFFFGGGLYHHLKGQFNYQAAYLATRGLVAIEVDHRTKHYHGTTIDKCSEDAKSAIRWVRSHPQILGIDPDRIAVAGSSGGGQMAAATCTVKGCDAPGEDLSISCQANLLLLFNPILDFSDEDRTQMVGSAEIARNISPNLNLHANIPPTVLFYGTEDPDLDQGISYFKQARSLGVEATLYTADGVGHGFIKQEPWLNATLYLSDQFLRKHGYLEGDPALPGDGAAQMREVKVEEVKDTPSNSSVRPSVRLAAYAMFRNFKTAQESHKVFGIGLSGTGSESLSEALNHLGIGTKYYSHNPNALNALLNGSKLPILEQYQGLVDGIAPFYRQLDQVYPGSKFILTVREKHSWLESMENLASTMAENVSWLNPEGEPLNEFLLYQLNYGLFEFNADRYWQAYEGYVQGVLDYFQNRPSDLLVMDIYNGDRWDKVCPFLELTLPSVPFPQSHYWKNLQYWSKQAGATWAYIEMLIPADCQFIFVDDCTTEASHRSYSPFLERDGQYWGAPPDDETAIAELERMRQAGAKFIAFASVAFWWFEFYSQFHDYLRSHFSCIWENECLVIFHLEFK